ncbi:MAG: tRNA (N(6)-L-threonylcarbamoyladenosine(37)-C(2))-methylthiotransferase MtaB [Acutalibacteraceae bacterium]|nr:tRNA (N(6)-L-threonylcarbamoyladenosine(37)-C(2))-methylthiotransferase MtaB [Acutalibacteraceae bacterium]
MKIAFHTLGCKVNQYETEVMRESFIKSGYTVVPDNAPFDIIVINSCTVTAESDRKTRQTLNRFRKENPEAVIVLTGCMVQAFAEKSKDLTAADIIVGNTDVAKIEKSVHRFLQEGERIFEVSEHKRTERFNTPNIKEFAERTRAYMKIEDGCDRFCTYCIIPTARGFVRSKPIADIKKEAEELAKNGFIEIVLVGINLTSYGKGEDMNLCDAVDAVCEVEGIKRVRLGSLEPDHITDRMLMRFKAQEKFCPQFHLSLQSGCDATLKRMNRHYDTAFYHDLVTRIRNMFPDSAITTDIMVGFAGETEQEFLESINFAKEMGFAKSHIFAYSRRSGTVAYNLKGQISKQEKSNRSKKMIEVTNQTEKEFLEGQIGKTVSVLFETNENGFSEGYTKNYTRVKVKTETAHSGEILNVKLISAKNGYCIGEFV